MVAHLAGKRQFPALGTPGIRIDVRHELTFVAPVTIDSCTESMNVGACMFGLSSFSRRLGLMVAIASTASFAGCVPLDDTEEEPIVVITDDDSSTPTETDGDPTMNPPPVTGEGCVDSDGDGWSVDCLDFGDARPDCDDEDPNNWRSCATCVDQDGDGVMGECDVYDGVDGPDCADDDPNNWDACATCVDQDGDGYFVGCDDFVTLERDCEDSAATVNAGADEVIGNGIDDDCDAETPDDCTYTPTPATDPEPGYLAGMTRQHNLWRWRVGVEPLQWDSALAQSATEYAEECIWEHSQNRSPDAGFSYVGENLYVTSVNPSNQSVVESVQSWADERFDFDFGFTTGETTGGMVGHYTQMVWAETTHVGCGWAMCDSVQGISFGGTMVVCRYGPGGNYTGEAPYDYQSGTCLDLDNDDVWQAVDPDDTDRSRQ